MIPRYADLMGLTAFWRLQRTLGLPACQEPAGVEQTRSFIFTPTTIGSTAKCLTVQKFVNPGASDFIVGML